MPSLPFAEDDAFYQAHGELLCASYERLLGRPLIEAEDGASLITTLYHAPFVVLSHGLQEDPIFNFANETAQALFELSWDDFIQLPSRKSAEPVHRDERKRLLDAVTNQGYIDNYSGVRIASSGQRFMIEKAVVWNLLDENGEYQGQAAAFSDWTMLPPK